MTTTKAMKAITAITLAMLTMILACSLMMTAYAEDYTMPAVVMGWEQIGDLDLYEITVVDENGHEWGFLEEEPLEIGDVVTLYMNKGETEEEDEIERYEWIGWLAPAEVAEWLEGC